MMDTAASPKRASRNPWPAAIVTFFFVAIVSCVSFVIFCIRHSEELVAANYYEQEVRHQQHMERAERAQRVVQPGAIAYDSRARAIRISLPLSHAGLTAAGTISLYRPSSAAHDQKLELRLDERGTQTLDTSSLLPGLWRVQVSWEAGGQDYYIEQKLDLRG